MVHGQHSKFMLAPRECVGHPFRGPRLGKIATVSPGRAAFTLTPPFALTGVSLHGRTEAAGETIGHDNSRTACLRA